MSKPEIRKLREIDPTAPEMIVYRECYKRGIDFCADVVQKEFKRIGCQLPERLKEIETLTPVRKWLKYIEAQQAKDNGKRYVIWTNDWLDYIRTASKLGMDTTRKSVLFPEDLKEAHDRVTADYKVNKDKNRLAEITRKARQEEYRTDDFMIVSATTQDMLNEESKALNHCVRTYGDKIAEGRCWIFFIRQISSPDTPYYTLETNTRGDFIQCRGKRNCNMTSEVEEFKDGFIKHLRKELRKERKQACQTA